MVAKAFNIILADEYVLLVKTRGFHWNVIGECFGPLHELFGKQYDKLADMTDEIAERIRQIEGFPAGSMKQFIDASTLTETDKMPDAKGMISVLLNDHESLKKSMCYMAEQICEKDPVTENLLLDWASKHQKMAWFLRSHVK